MKARKRFFAVFGGMADSEIRKPKSEDRKTSEIRSPKISLHGLPLQPRSAALGQAKREGREAHHAEVSVFELRDSFGSRISVFGFDAPKSIGNGEELLLNFEL
jgi:hypothetical protein